MDTFQLQIEDFDAEVKMVPETTLSSHFLMSSILQCTTKSRQNYRSRKVHSLILTSHNEIKTSGICLSALVQFNGCC